MRTSIYTVSHEKYTLIILPYQKIPWWFLGVWFNHMVDHGNYG